MIDPVSVTRNGHRTFLKWHRARRRGTDPVFTGRRILEGMALGASVEVDLVVHKDRGFAVLHDHLSIARETTGQGSAVSHTAAELRSLRLRDNDGKPIADHVMLLEDLCALLVQTPPHPDALLQLDYKEDESVLDGPTVETFARATRPIARNMIVSSGSARAVEILTEAVPGMLRGFDPSDEDRFRAALAAGNLQGFVDDALAAAPAADFIYLDWRIVTYSADAGFDIVTAFHNANKRVDAWTIKAADDASLLVVQRLLALGADQITTDDPEGLAARLGAS